MSTAKDLSLELVDDERFYLFASKRTKLEIASASPTARSRSSDVRSLFCAYANRRKNRPLRQKKSVLHRATF